MEELSNEERSRLVEKLGVIFPRWVRTVDGTHVGVVQTTKLFPENIGYCIEVLPSEYNGTVQLDVIKQLREQLAINSIIEFYEKENSDE
jgi:hypothetical protein